VSLQVSEEVVKNISSDEVVETEEDILSYKTINI
jgi:hypothetical protein